MEKFDIIKRELVVISGEKMAFQQEAYDSIAKTERATSLMHVELREACDSIAKTEKATSLMQVELRNSAVRLSELHPEIKKTDGTITSVKNMVAVTNFRVKDLQNNMSKLVKRSPVMILF